MKPYSTIEPRKGVAMSTSHFVKTALLALIFGGALHAAAEAESATSLESAASNEAEMESEQPITKADAGRILREVLDPGGEITHFAESAIPGLMEVDFQGQTIYLSRDGKYAIPGEMFQLDGGVTSMVEERRRAVRVEYLAALTADDYIAFAPKGEVKAVVTVFTDVDCGYCRKLHNEMGAYHDLGIEIHYIAYPRAGIGSDTYKNMVSAWCADDRQSALTRLKNGAQIPERSCDSPVAEQFRWGERVGVRGTPQLILPDGSVIPGYVPAEDLAKRIGI